MIRLKCATQCYDWGKVGNDSIVYQLQVAAQNPDEFQSNIPYAELWMGTHPSGPSRLWDHPNVTLEDHIRKNPACLGKSSSYRFECQLPFLFKVLSVAKALSIQAHPDKNLAVRLHAEHPEIYKDDNHKPEMTIALTEFEALLGFRSLHHILTFIQAFPELAELIITEQTSPGQNKGESCSTCKQLYVNLMQSSPEKVETVIKSLVDRFTTCSKPVCNLPVELQEDVQALIDLFLRLTRMFPGDVGCLSVFFLNYFKLQPGEAIFIKANTPHAYISGDCVECMANSDNVVRAGLTPKFKDVEKLLEMLDYSSSQDSLRFSASQIVSTTAGVTFRSFTPPVSEFAVDVMEFDEESRGFSIPVVPTASIILFIRGEGTATCAGADQTCLKEMKFGPGFGFFVPADQMVSVVSKADRRGSLHAFRVYGNRQ